MMTPMNVALSAPPSMTKRLTAGLVAGLKLVLLWHQRNQDRRSLLQMEAHMLRDIGLSRDDVCRETAKPFWMA